MKVWSLRLEIIHQILNQEEIVQEEILIVIQIKVQKEVILLEQILEKVNNCKSEQISSLF